MFKFDHIHQTIVCSKSALRKAGDPATAEYKALMEMMEKQPTFTVVAREIKKATNKKTYKGLDIKAIRAFVGDDAEKKRELDKALELGGYPMAKHWFLNTYEKPTMTKIKNTVSKAKIAKVRLIKPSETKLAPLAPASGQ